MNLRGVRESGHGVRGPDLRVHHRGVRDARRGRVPGADRGRPGRRVGVVRGQPATQASGLLLVALALRAFASGCTALTGVEAVSNGVPQLQAARRARNAAATLAIMGALTVTMFVGITALALVSEVHVARRHRPAGRRARPATSSAP